MADNTITIAGNITRVPELTFLNNGQASVKLGVAVNRRWLDKQTQEWEERVSFFDVVAYGTLAENVANTLDKGNRVVVSGRLEQRSWEDDNGQKRSAVEINADEIAPSLRWATAVLQRNERKNTEYNQAAAPVSYEFDEEPF
jgi:single-strand DNA-binding protein